MKKIKVLHYYTQFNLGGTEKVISTILNNVDKERFECYFLSLKQGTNENELNKEKITILRVNSNNFENELFDIFIKYGIDVLHVHNCKEMNRVLKVAKKCGIKIRIAHSHVARVGAKFIVKFLKSIKSIPTEIYANRYIACSLDAAKWLFPHKLSDSTIIFNAVKYEKFKFDSEKREKTRKKLRLCDDEFLITMVSRLSNEKNHLFILPVLKRCVLKNPNIKLLIIGDGPNYFEINKMISQLDLKDKVLLLGNISNVADYLSASDLFVMPSKFEGLGISAVEAQMNGLYTLCSDRVPNDIDIGKKLVEFLELDEGIWENKILKQCKSIKKTRKSFSSSKYDLIGIIEEIEKIYSGELV